ncbi:MAG: hypothetical protein DMG09_09055 [Acidobacteria bacterium]|nr:MAG: hypothetical protein DMG09_09055 [Acidobacteriota bacterium]
MAEIILQRARLLLSVAELSRQKKENYEGAVTEYQAILKLSPELAEVSSNLGLIY